MSGEQAGYVVHIVCNSPEAYQELCELVAKWAPKKNAMYVDWEQSVSSYMEEQPLIPKKSHHD